MYTKLKNEWKSMVYDTISNKDMNLISNFEKIIDKSSQDLNEIGMFVNSPLISSDMQNILRQFKDFLEIESNYMLSLRDVQKYNV